ncbi:MAG: DUF6261 family protein [Prevotellaceae bacterium]|jgi:hypothetical protein|nr:DUF6261 family protein [Prevotellaceae bacterium]
MQKILRALLHFFRNEAHFEFMGVFKGRLNEYPDAETVVQEYVDDFDELLTAEGKVVDAQKKSSYTAQIVEADHLDDQLVLGIKESVTAATRHYDPTVAAAAIRLHDRIKVFGQIPTKSYEEEAAAISILLTDLQSPAFAADVTTVGIGGWLTQLAAALANFKSLLQLRNDEYAENLPQENTKEIRSKIDAVYHKMTNRIDAAAELDSTGLYDEFIMHLNADIRYFNEHNTHRHAKKDLGTGDHTVVEPIETQRYTEKPITPIPKVYYRIEGKPTEELSLGKDFTVTYKNNTDVGTALLTIHGKGAYKGQFTVTFNIAR